MDMKISIATYAFHGMLAQGVMDVFGSLESVRFRYDLRGVDIWNGFFAQNETAFDPKIQQQIREGLTERDITHANYCVDGCHIWWDTPQERDAAKKVAMQQLAAGAAMGAKTVRIDAGGQGSTWTDQQFDVIAAGMREFAAFAHDHGIKAGPESHWGAELVPDNMERLAKAVDHPGFGILMHMGHWEGTTAAEGDRRLAPWAMHTHIDQRTSETRLEEVVQILQEADYDGYFGVEHHTGKNEYAQVACQVAAIRRVLAAQLNTDPGLAPKLTKPGGMPTHIESQ